MAVRPFTPVLLCCLLACASKPATPSAAPSDDDPAQTQTETDAPAAATSDEALVSVRPGVNDRYFKPGAVETWTETLEQERREVIAKREQIVAALALQPGLVVGDVGSGTGAFLAPLSHGIGPSGKLYAIDIVPSFLEHLRARAEQDGLENVEVIEATPTDVALAAASVDLLFMCDVYHHIEYPQVYNRSLHRALRDDGRLIIVEFDKIPGKTSERMMKHVRQDKPTLIAELAEAGFELEREISDVPLSENYMLIFRKVPR